VIIWFVLSNLWSFHCKDYDAGKDIDVASVTVSNIKTCQASTTTCVTNQIIERDACITQKQVLEYYCHGEESKALAIDCPADKTCSDGYCQ
jgi:hypothetical protein